MFDSEKLSQWLSEKSSVSADGRYVHRVLTENEGARAAILADLISVIEQAHSDAKQRLRELADLSLDPIVAEIRDPAEGYPEKLHPITLQGYFGEILAAIVAEALPHFGISGWEIAAFPFRFHQVAFDQLEKWRQTGEEPTEIPGRTGNDALAFRRNADGYINQTLVCEAKCTRDHKAALINNAHLQISDDLLKPVEILRIIEILTSYDDVKSKDWVRALRELYIRDLSPDYERCDLVSYACGHRPTRKTSWIPADSPNKHYSAERRLEAIEIYLEGMLNLITTVYGIDID